MASKTTRVKIAKAHITDAAKKAEAGMPTGVIEIFADDAVAGLQLRVQGQRAFWTLKYGTSTKNVGEVYSPKPMTREVPSITEARELAGSCKKVLDSVPDLFDSILNRYFEEPVGQRNFEDARTGIRRKATTWTLQQCFDYVIEDRTKEKAPEPIGDLYADELRLSLRRPQMKDVLTKPAVELSRGDFDAVREGILSKNGVSPANKTLSHVRMVLDYCMRKASKDSGLDHKDEWWKLIESAGAVKKRNRMPTVDDIVKILVVAEEYLEKPLPGRTDGKHGVRPNVFAGLWWLCLTAQRTYAALHLPRDRFFQDKSGEAPSPEWYLASWPDEVMKSVEFILPIPPRVAAHMKPLMEAAKTDGSEWAFPSERGSAENDIALGSSAVRQFLQRLRAKDPLMNKGGKRNPAAVDFFEKLDVPWWSPHDLRRTIGKELDKAGIPGGSSAVLAHKIKMPERPMNDRERAAWAEQHVEDITRQAYHDPVHMQLKAKAITVWADAILDRYEELSPRAQAKIQEKKRIQRARFVFKDALGVEKARETALTGIQPLIEAQRSKIGKIEKMIATMMSEEPVPLKDIAFAKDELVGFQDELDRLITNPGKTLIKPSEESRKQGLDAIMNPGFSDYDFRSEAPDYCELRDRYITGQISIEAFKAILSDRHGYDFSMDTQSMYLPGREPVSAIAS
ncbi:hypothetical protein [Agrobacterium tumefaciens]|uniref:hypothetical protein n=1 Tax=Agrobacterium tumefaciens TaxID=358 RepID=UPI000AB0CAFC|nr:hypothetical protein [Agrobacterium tumefaciens]